VQFASIGRSSYDAETRIVSVWFVTSRKRYDYEAVAPEVYQAFREAYAKGQFFNDHIRNRYRDRLIVPD
jgi:hypothetical protein